MIHYIGCDDPQLDLFESQYAVPAGMAYNSYVIDDERVAVIDTIDQRCSGAWQQKLLAVLAGREPDWLVVQHLEPDHSANIAWLMARFPACRMVCTAKAAQMLPQFFQDDLAARVRPVKEGDELRLGQHTLRFLTAQMVHWPEVMVSYDTFTGTLFSADAFGKFGTLSADRLSPADGLPVAAPDCDWACEARRYYFNICGKYGAPVQSLLRKVGALDVRTICPLHGPVLRGDLGYYTGLYNTWSRYEPETQGVFVAYASLHGHTAAAALDLADTLREKGCKVATADLARADMAECVEDAFRYDRLCLCASSYDGGVMPAMADFLAHLKSKNFQRRRVALVENGSWAPSAARTMRKALEEMKDLDIVATVATIRTTVNAQSQAQLDAIAELLAGN